MSSASAAGVKRGRAVRHRQAHDRMSEPGMGKKRLWALLAVIVSCVIPHGLAAETLKIASPQRGSWEGAIPELGKEAGIFRKHGLELDILYTQGGGETLQIVISGAVDIGLSAAPPGTLHALATAPPAPPTAPRPTCSP